MTLEINKMHESYLPYLNGLGLSTDDILIFAECDMQDECVPGNSAVFVTKDALYKISGTRCVISSDSNSRCECVYKKENSEVYSIEDIDSLRLENYVSSAALVLQKNGESKIICYLSNRYKDDFYLLCKYFNAYKNDGEIVPEQKDFGKENFCPKCGGRYTDPSRKICAKCMDKKGLLKRLWPFLKEFKVQIFLILITLILTSALGVVVPYISSAFFYDQVLDETGKYYGKLLFVLCLVIGTSVLKTLINALSGVITATVSAKVIYKLKKTIFGSINRLSLSFFTGRQTGGLMTQVNSDADSIYKLFVEGIPTILINAIQILSVFVIMLILNPLLTVLSVSVVPVFMAVLGRFLKKVRKLHLKRFTSSRAMNSTISDALTGVRVVKAFAGEGEECERFNEKSKTLAEDSKRVITFNNTAFPLSNMIMYLSTIIIWGVGGYMVMRGYGGMEYGVLLTFVSYIGMVNSPMFTFVDMSQWLPECFNALQRLFEIDDAEPDIREPEKPIEPENFEGRVEFRNVEFSYTKERKIIDNISFEIEPGTIMGIVGHTGAGKSTLANLLIRLYDVSSGGIYIDGINVKDYPSKTLRDNIAIVSQDTYLFSGSIFDNIKYACPEAGYEDVIKAAKLAGAHNFILKMPEGYNTKIGFGAKELSGGERQRISIARAVLKNPKILILDEATAAMDTETEKTIQTAINRLVKGRTAIMIAHRLSTLRDADKLVVIERGKVCEFGTHKELLEKQGVYHKLYKLQMEAMKNIGVE